MRGRQHKAWLHFRKDILAADHSSAVLLTQYLLHVAIVKLYGSILEVYDLQHYKLIKKPAKVCAALRDRIHTPFIFAAGKN